MKKIAVFDSTLRDGAQGEGISYTLHDKFVIAKELDKLSIDYIEAGTPFSNPKDMEFFLNAADLKLQHAKLVAFGLTRRKDVSAADDESLKALLRADTEVVTVVGKANSKQVTEVINTTLENNLSMIYDTVKFLKDNGKKVFFDAEHFFDGYKTNKEYTISCISEAERAGADTIILCDTNGSTFPNEISKIVSEVSNIIKIELGIHCHNDNGCAVANSIMAVKSGCIQVQGTYLGFGERCGNTNLSSLIPSLQLKMKYHCIKEDKMHRLTKAARLIAEVSNISLDKSLPYVGASAFSHKGGMHVDGVNKNTSSFEHIPPETVGNKRNILVSEMSGRAAMLSVINDIDPTITKESVQAQEITALLKQLENRGYLFESASASLELLITKELNRFRSFFKLQRFKVIGEQGENRHAGVSTAMIKIRVGEETEITASEGEGPVHALDKALKKAVTRFYPSVQQLRLTDYKVRVMEPSDATAATVRVLITTSNGEDIWTTVGVSRDIIEASLAALLDSIEYPLMKEHNSVKVSDD